MLLPQQRSAFAGHSQGTGDIGDQAQLGLWLSLWLGKAENPSLQCVYGISFPDKKILLEHKERVAQAEGRDQLLFNC